MKNGKVNAINLGLALGIVWILGVFLIWLSNETGAGWLEIFELLGNAYPGTGPGLNGLFVGVVWGFLDGFIGGWLIGTVYNWLQGRK